MPNPIFFFLSNRARQGAHPLTHTRASETNARNYSLIPYNPQPPRTLSSRAQRGAQNKGINTQTGFSLIEMMWVIAIIGIVLAITDFGGIAQLNNRYYASKQELINKNIASALLQYAKTSTTLATLPAPYTGGGYNSTVFNPATTAIAQVFRSANMAPSEINDDGTTAQNVRVYQTVSLTQATPLYFQSGPLTTLTYQYAAVHQTTCMKSVAACNKVSPNIPGVSAAMTSANYQTWTTTSPDLRPEFFSTLPMQKQMLAQTAQRLADLRDKLAGQFRTKQISAAADDTTNWYPFAYQAADPATPNPNLAGANAATNQGCHDGWYNLNAANVNILAQLGMTQTQYAATAWGGQIEYCRDYDPALRGAASLPTFAALRAHQSVSTGASPDNAVASNNFFITF